MPIILEISELERLMQEHYDPTHHVVLLQNVDKALIERGDVDIVETALRFCEHSRIYAESMFDLVSHYAIQEKLSTEQARRYLRISETLGEYDSDFYFKMISVLEYGRYIHLLAYFMIKTFVLKKGRDWRHITFSIAGHLVGGGHSYPVPVEFIHELQEEALRVENSNLRSQYIEIAGKLLEKQNRSL